MAFKVSRTALALLAAISPYMPILCFAPAVNGTTAGTVTDISGKAIANAKVATNREVDGSCIKATPTEAATMRCPTLLPGNYKVIVESTGFKTATQDELFILEAI